MILKTSYSGPFISLVTPAQINAADGLHVPGREDPSLAYEMMALLTSAKEAGLVVIPDELQVEVESRIERGGVLSLRVCLRNGDGSGPGVVGSWLALDLDAAARTQHGAVVTVLERLVFQINSIIFHIN